MHPGFIDQEQVVAAGFAGYIDIFAQLDISFSPQDGQAAISPGGQPVRGKPIYPDKAGTVLAA